MSPCLALLCSAHLLRLSMYCEESMDLYLSSIFNGDTVYSSSIVTDTIEMDTSEIFKIWQT